MFAFLTFSPESFLCGMRYNLPRCSFIFPLIGDQESAERSNVDFVVFEDVDGMEVFVNPERVIWVREYPNQTTVISCGHEDQFAVRLAPAHAVAALVKTVR